MSCSLTKLIERMLAPFFTASPPSWIARVNLLIKKSSIWFSPNTSHEVRSDVFGIILGFNLSAKPWKYLGFNLGMGKKKVDFNPIIKKIEDKIGSLKSKLLSHSGRITLIKSATSAITAYYMQALPFPVSVCKTIDKLHRNFLWDSGWMKLNSDGSCNSSTKDIVAGGIIRDDNGNWVSGYSKYIGKGNAIIAELWGVVLGLGAKGLWKPSLFTYIMRAMGRPIVLPNSE
ncbi:reverse transcriptase [Senna tora]|uniref:Reverse transcriptase n=1 Tax=Senna tora TaxID=362788 RepID=A0A834TD88_9FABA|nr:reverse transcriptase [Senna tora]